MRVAIIGSGSYGCVLANVIKNNGHDVKIWSFSEDEMKDINEKHYCRYINGEINKDIKCTLSLEDAVKDTDFIFIVTPSFAVRSTCKELSKYITNQCIIIASKGLEGSKVLTEVAAEEVNKDYEKSTIGVISGPSHAEQIYDEVATYFNYNGPEEVKTLLSNEDIKLKFSDDPKGMQLAAALKNIVAINVGEVLGLYNKGVKDFNDINFEKYSNVIAAVIVEGLKEITTVGKQMGSKSEIFYDYAGLGDLITTTLSVHSRNLKCGIRIGQGDSLDDIKNEIGMTIEGLNAIDSAMQIISENNLTCPLISSLYNKVHKYDNMGSGDYSSNTRQPKLNEEDITKKSDKFLSKSPDSSKTGLGR